MIRFLMLAATLLVAACSGSQAPLAASSDGAVVLADAYKLGVGDRFRLNVFNEPSLSGAEYSVNGEGSASLPLIGPVPVGGKTLREAEQTIRDRYANGFLSSPKVNIDITVFRPFYILGEVKNPGEYPYAGGLTLLSAVAKAGGFTYRSDQRRVYVRRAGEGPEKEVLVRSDTPVLPGDTIRILERFF